jgi:hypothetical protein
VSAGRKFNAAILALGLGAGAWCLGIVSLAHAASPQSPSPGPLKQAPLKKKTKKSQKPQLPALPSGPTGPVQAIPLDSMAPVPPQVSYQNAQLTIVAANSTLGDILRAVRKQTGAEIEIPSATERVVTHLGPGPAREVMADLLNGSRFNYVLLGSPEDSAVLSRVVLVAKTGPDNAIPNDPNSPLIAEQAQPGIVQRPVGPGGTPMPEAGAEANDAQPAEDDDADQAAAEAEQQQQPSPDQPAVKTPQQMLQEMQQRQLQLQQQQQSGQPPVPGPGAPPRPPQEQP